MFHSNTQDTTLAEKPMLHISFNEIPPELSNFLDEMMTRLCRRPEEHLRHAAVPYKHVTPYRRSYDAGTLSRFQVQLFPGGRLRYLGMVTDARVGALIAAAAYIDDRLVRGGVQTVQSWIRSMHDAAERSLWMAAATPSLGRLLSEPMKRVHRVKSLESAPASPADNVQEQRGVPPAATQTPMHGGDGGCTAMALVKLGVWTSLDAATKALDAEIGRLHGELVRTQGGCIEGEAGILGERWHVKAVKNALKRIGWHVSKVHIDPTHPERVQLREVLKQGRYVAIGVINSRRWSELACSKEVVMQPPGYSNEPIGDLTSSPERSMRTIAIVDGKLRDYGVTEPICSLSLQDDNQPDPEKGYMHSLYSVWRVSEYIEPNTSSKRARCESRASLPTSPCCRTPDGLFCCRIQPVTSPPSKKMAEAVERQGVGESRPSVTEDANGDDGTEHTRLRKAGARIMQELGGSA